MPSREVVPGDVVLLSAGSLVPADGVLLEATDCFVNEAVLTGESFPTEKTAALAPPGATVRERANCVFMGINVRSGFARLLRPTPASLLVALVVRTQRPFFRSRPGRLLLVLTGAVTALACALPYLPGSRLLGFVALSAPLMLAVAAIAVLNVTVTELAKRRFYRVASSWYPNCSPGR